MHPRTGGHVGPVCVLLGLP
ncbi:hypothetical protein L345_18377 [Ophiophagus hannah]|uniref:Uncharacterized protein n=1 Tax=Ophiophagus hannah TaxID=8665 RepID=V8N0T5_OPHHA|nr:hypothetical protein L345_18377 [Ophiophagus hannah]